MNPTQRLAKLALIYISRADMKGNEVPTYVEVFNWLTGISEAPVTALPDPAIVGEIPAEAPPNDPPVQG